MADRYHRLRNALGILAYPRTQSSTEQNNLHGPKSRGSTTFTLGIKSNILQPQEPAWEICLTILLFKFHRGIKK